MFDWDAANLDHVSKRNISRAKVEQAIVDPNAVEARVYSTEDERRSAIVGMAEDGDLLFVVYTERRARIRPFHVRRANRKEPKDYERRR